MRARSAGFTLLEVLIAISVFALIGVGSFRVLTGVIASQKVGEEHSVTLAQFQKALLVIDRDLQQIAARSIREGPQQRLGPLLVYTGEYTLELTRGGWQNPLGLPRSSLQRIAYDIGPHPKADNANSRFYGDQRQYLLRYYWPALDREQGSLPIVQPLIPDIEDLQVTVISNRGRHRQWPLPSNAGNKPPEAEALEFSLSSSSLGIISRIYKIERL